MFQDIYLQRFADLLGTTCLQCAVDFVDGAAKGVVFAAADPDGAKAHGGKIGLLLLQCVIEGNQVVGNVAGAMR